MRPPIFVTKRFQYVRAQYSWSFAIGRRRLRAAGVSFEDRQDLLGHRSGRITTHYSAAELSRLIAAANRVCERKSKKPELVMLRRLNIS